MNIVTGIRNTIREIWINLKGETWEFKYSTTLDEFDSSPPRKCTCGLNQPPSINHGTKCDRFDPDWIVPKNRVDLNE